MITYQEVGNHWGHRLEHREPDFVRPYLSIQGFLAAGPSAAPGPMLLFLLSWSALNLETLLPGTLTGAAGSVWITMLAAAHRQETIRAVTFSEKSYWKLLHQALKKVPKVV